MKRSLFTCVLFAVAATCLANHTKGGWMYYRYAGPGATANSSRYVITLKIYTECILTENQWCPNVNISIFDATNNSLVANQDVPNSAFVDIQNCTRQECHECISDIPNICYKIATFEYAHDLPINNAGYIVSYQRCCRVANIINLLPGSATIGDTWVVNIPGTGGNDPLAYKNSSALFVQNDTAIICKGAGFHFDFGATDPDGDSLAYAFTDAYYASRGNGVECTAVSEAPPYRFVNYLPPFSGSRPLGAGVTINPSTGLVSGIAPTLEGTYVLTCTVTEYNRSTGALKSSVHKSLHIFVADCSLTQAILQPVYYSCDGFTKSFNNEALGGNIKTYSWDFGVKGSAADTSNRQYPVFTYPDTGTYVLKLVVNRNLPCSDSAESIVRVYPVFAPGFNVQGQCKNTPISFFDQTTTTFGMVNSWNWDFGDLVSDSNHSELPKPTHYYTGEGSYSVSLAVTNDLGCAATFIKQVLVTDRPAFSLTHDTLICTTDTLQLQAIGRGTIAWSPDYNISSLNSTAPFVSPDVPTRYYARLTDPYGCNGTDSVLVDVRNQVTLQAMPDTTICQSDAVLLFVAGDALHYRWSANTPALNLDDPFRKTPLATPLSTTVYHVVASIGKCVADDSVSVTVVPYPAADAGADTTICFGTMAQLHASGGSIYSWSPPSLLANALIPAPGPVQPPVTTRYTVSVSDTLGCPKAVTSSVLVTVSLVKADAGVNDTTVVLEQPLQLGARGGTIYDWSPASVLDNAHLAAPIAMPQDDVTFFVKVSDAAGCSDTDSIHVRVYKVAADIYVPTAFSPNNDGRNDFFRPAALGLRSLDIFCVFNRWGQLVYTSNGGQAAGWDGTYKGNRQEPGTYTWFAEGTDYRNRKFRRRGFVVLLR